MPLTQVSAIGAEIAISGAVLSNVIDELFVVAVTAVPALPARSVKLMEKPTVPSVSLPVIVYSAFQSGLAEFSETEAD